MGQPSRGPQAQDRIIQYRKSSCKMNPFSGKWENCSNSQTNQQVNHSLDFSTKLMMAESGYSRCENSQIWIFFFFTVSLLKMRYRVWSEVFDIELQFQLAVGVTWQKKNCSRWHVWIYPSPPSLSVTVLKTKAASARRNSWFGKVKR